jgi:histidyl-tRNA synthetase
MRSIDKQDKIGLNGVKELLGPGRLDDSGDFTPGAKLRDDQIDTVHRFLLIARTEVHNEDGTRDYRAQFDMMRRLFGSSEIGTQGIDEVEQIAALVQAAGYEKKIWFASDVVRGLEYYTGPVFEAELLFEVKDEEGRPIRFGSVGGGGRYDGLVSRFLDEPVPATGFSIGVSRLRAALDKLAEMRGETTGEVEGPVIVLAMDKTREAMASYQQIVASLRGAGIPSEIYLGSAGMKAQLKYADKRNARVALIQGSNEREKGEVQVKDLILGATLTDIKDRTEYLAKQAEVQFAVPVSEVVAKVREVLAKHR